jgi:hypothetical protein
MRHFYLFIATVILAGCANRKAEIVEEIKATKAKLYDAESQRSKYKSASNKLSAYHTALDASRKYKSKQMEMDAQAYKEGYEMAIQHLKDVSPNILKDRKKLDSVALKYELKTWELQHQLDSLELELKKY